MVDSAKIKIKDWGKDHWSTLMYVETRVVDHDGLLDPRHMRGHREGWEQYPSRLRSGVELYGHNDFDCVEDMIAEGLVERDGPVVLLTDRGWALASDLRRWKASGKGIAKFVVGDSDLKDDEEAPF